MHKYCFTLQQQCLWMGYTAELESITAAAISIIAIIFELSSGHNAAKRFIAKELYAAMGIYPTILCIS